jgi:hypothetical protein
VIKMTLNIKKCAISIEAKILTRATLQT